MRQLETIPARFQPDPIYDKLRRITNFFYDDHNILCILKNPHPRRAYWQKGELIGRPFHYFRQIRYFPLEDQRPNLILALEGAIIDCGEDVHKMIIDYRTSYKCWMTLQVQFETAILSASATRIFNIDGIVNGWENPYAGSLHRLTERINELNSKYIRDKSGLQLSGINQLIMKCHLTIL
jgi:hypothetical protein